jgi:hypothetical protein
MTFEVFSYWFTLFGIIWLSCGLITFLLGCLIEGIDSDDLCLTPLILAACLAFGFLGLVGIVIDNVDWEKFSKKA